MPVTSRPLRGQVRGELGERFATAFGQVGAGIGDPDGEAVAGEQRRPGQADGAGADDRRVVEVDHDWAPFR